MTCRKNYTVKPVLRDHCDERPTVLTDHIFLAGPPFQYNWTCHQRPPSWQTIFFCGQWGALSRRVLLHKIVHVTVMYFDKVTELKFHQSRLFKIDIQSRKWNCTPIQFCVHQSFFDIWKIISKRNRLPLCEADLAKKKQEFPPEFSTFHPDLHWRFS